MKTTTVWQNGAKPIRMPNTVGGNKIAATLASSHQEPGDGNRRHPEENHPSEEYQGDRMKRTKFYVNEKNFEPLFNRFNRTFRTPVVVPSEKGDVTFYRFDKCSNCLTIFAKADWNISAAEAKKILESHAGFALLPRERNISAREYALMRAKELLGPNAVTRFFPKETKRSKFRCVIGVKSVGTVVSTMGYGSDWDNALKVAVLAKTGWFFDNEVETDPS